jgi:ribosomal protein S20
VRILVSQKKNEEAKKNLPKIYEILDKAAKNGLIKKNKADRLKSRVAKNIAKNNQK